MTKRTTVKRRGQTLYVRRKNNGKFAKGNTAVKGRAIASDKRRKAKKKNVPSGQGHTGDTRKPKKKKNKKKGKKKK